MFSVNKNSIPPLGRELDSASVDMYDHKIKNMSIGGFRGIWYSRCGILPNLSIFTCGDPSICNLRLFKAMN